MKADFRIPLAIGAALVLAAIVAFGAPHMVGDYFVRILLLMALNSILVLSLSLSNGFTGVFSLGHVGFIGAGAYAAGILSLTVQQKKALLPHLPDLLNWFSLPHRTQLWFLIWNAIGVVVYLAYSRRNSLLARGHDA